MWRLFWEMLMLVVMTLAISTPMMTHASYILKTTIPILPKSNYNIILAANSSNPYTIAKVGYAVLFTNLWNLNMQSVGYSMIKYIGNAGSIEFLDNYSLLKPTTLSDVTVGFPSIIYGYRVWGPLVSTMAPLLELPEQVNNLPQVWVFVNYTVIHYSPSNLDFDVEYQMWLTSTSNETNGARYGDVEIVIYLYTHGMQPGGVNAGSFTIPIIINGTLINETYDVWVYNGDGSNSEMWTIVWLVPHINTTSSLIGLNMTYMVYEVCSILSNKWPSMWSMSKLLRYYLDDIELGHNFGTKTQVNNATLDILISQYYFVIMSSWSNATELTLIPESNVKSNVVATATPANPYATSVVGYIYITPNLWNMNTASSSGSASVIYDASQGALYIHVDFAKVYLNQPVGVAAYSEFIYGYKPWGVMTSEANGFNFPIKLTELGTLLSFINYTLLSYSPQEAIFDWAYDLWLTTSPNLTNGPQPGDVEVMIWLYYHLQQPAGVPVSTVSVPIWVNGTLFNETFEVWVGSPIIVPGTHAIVSFRPTNPIPRGLVGVNITEFLWLAMKYLVTLYPNYWNYTYLESKYLDGVEFGSEWGNPSTYSVNLNWVIYNAYLIRIPRTLPLPTIRPITPTYPSLSYIESTIPWCSRGNVNLLLTTTSSLPGPWDVVNYSGGKLLLFINMWNLAYLGSGNATMAFNAETGEVCFSTLISSVVLLNPSANVWGYPEVYIDGVHPGTSLGAESPALPLPQRVLDLINGTYFNRFILVNYSVWVPSVEPMDWAFDMWLTKTPNEHSLGNGDAELMIWLYTTTPSFTWAYTGINVTIPLLVNGSMVNVTYAIHVDCVHGSGWTYIAFVPVNGGFANAYINMSLAPFLEYMTNILPQVCPSLWSSPSQVSNLWLDDIELGSEIGSQQWATNPGWGAIAWRLYEAKIVAPSTYITSTTTTTTYTSTSTTIVTSSTTQTITSTTTVTSTITATSTLTLTTSIVKVAMPGYDIAALVVMVMVVVVIVIITLYYRYRR